MGLPLGYTREPHQQTPVCRKALFYGTFSMPFALPERLIAGFHLRSFSRGVRGCSNCVA